MLSLRRFCDCLHLYERPLYCTLAMDEIQVAQEGAGVVRLRWMSGVLGLSLVLLIVPVAHAESSRPAAPKAAQADGPDYAAFVKNGHKPVVTPLDKMTPSSMPFATEISPPIQEPNCAQAPATFNPASASTADLMKYGLPPQAKNESRASWLSQVNWMKHRVCVSYQTNAPPHGINISKSVQSSQITNRALFNYPQMATSNIWAGNVADQSCGLGCYNGSYWYTEVNADWTIPCLTPVVPFPVSSSAWVGLGGTENYYELIQAGSDSDEGDPAYMNYYLWYEYWGSTGEIRPVQVNLGPNNTQNQCGDHVYARVYGGDCYELGDIGDGLYFEDCTGPSATGNTAEGVAERNAASGSGGSSGEGLADFGSVDFHGVGATEESLGYRAFNNLQHDFYNMQWGGGWLAKTDSIVSDSEAPYDQYGVTWYSICGGYTTCS